MKRAQWEAPPSAGAALTLGDPALPLWLSLETRRREEAASRPPPPRPPCRGPPAEAGRDSISRGGWAPTAGRSRPRPPGCELSGSHTGRQTGQAALGRALRARALEPSRPITPPPPPPLPASRARPHRALPPPARPPCPAVPQPACPRAKAPRAAAAAPPLTMMPPPPGPRQRPPPAENQRELLAEVASEKAPGGPRSVRQGRRR